ncbi:RodZ domain-containing protein [Rheinheimera sp. UJ63]|uniref:RodZ domain-containing protein n=1 Tax=Rheinheimera sp. UJ63 TaxID=2910157 RepID=UPI001F361966|nr:RodZ domain-containing protein [Rheinheimera sp. UJ63]MCF4010157.1 DUF4115 domain-containing protein [Rheinheimera sp. UJ63]
MTNDEQLEASSAPELTVGQILRQTREKRGLSLKDVAQQLNLKAEVLQCIEADEPDKNILPTFMRGYVRAYARYLKLPELPLLKQFEQAHHVNSAPVKTMKTFSNRQAKQQTEARFMWLTYLIAAILLASLAIWFWQGSRDFVTSDSLPTSSTTPALTESSGTIPLTQTVTQPSSWESPPAANNAADNSNEPESSVSESVTQSNPSALPSSVPVVELPAPSTDTLLAPENNELATESFGDSNDSGLDRLKMTFAENCWIDVVDASGERVAYGTKQAGYIMELNAKAPFVITLGNPSVVAIELNQQPYDMSKYPGGRVAKFTLSGQNE